MHVERNHEPGGKALTAILRAIWPLLIFLAVFLTVGGVGFNPTDEGVLAAAAARVLEGQVPHLDLITPRTALSAYLHAPETLLPTPLFMTGRAVALAEVTLYSLFLAWLAVGTSPARWGPWLVLGCSASVLLNLNTFNLMPWYTVDAILFASAGFILLRGTEASGVRWRVLAATICLAIAAMAKQSFLPALVAGLVWIALTSPRSHRPQRMALALVGAGGALGAYCGAVALAGGWSPMASQLTASEPILFGQLLAPLDAPGAAFLLIGAPAVLVGARNIGPRTSPAVRRLAFLASAVAVTALVLMVIATSGLRLTAYWGVAVTWILAAYLVSDAIAARRLDSSASALLLVAWMTSLSYGQPVPNLVAGSVVLTLLHRVWRDQYLELGRLRLPALKPALAVFLVVAGISFVGARSEYVHRDRPPSELTFDLGGLSGELAGIRTNERTGEYLQLMRRCADAFPADRIAVLPDNAAVYPAFGWTNPLPLDFLFPPEYAGARDQLLSAVELLAAEGDFLVLFQRDRADSLQDASNGATTSGFHAYDLTLMLEIRDVLLRGGESIECDGFEGVYAARL